LKAAEDNDSDETDSEDDQIEFMLDQPKEEDLQLEQHRHEGEQDNLEVELDDPRTENTDGKDQGKDAIREMTGRQDLAEAGHFFKSLPDFEPAF